MLTKDSEDSIKKAVQLQLFLARFDTARCSSSCSMCSSSWNSLSTLGVQTIVERAIHLNHPTLNATQLTIASATLLQECVFTKESHQAEFHHYFKLTEESQQRSIRREDVQMAHLQWKQFCNCTGLTNGNLNMYFLIYVLDFLDTLRSVSPTTRTVLLAIHGVDEESR